MKTMLQEIHVKLFASIPKTLGSDSRCLSLCLGERLCRSSYGRNGYGVPQ